MRQIKSENMSSIPYKLKYESDFETDFVALLVHSTWNTILQVETRLKMQPPLFYLYTLNDHRTHEKMSLLAP